MSTRCSCAFYAGYSLTQIAGGWLAARVPANRVLVAIVVTWSAATVATAAAGPSLGAARTPLLFALRMIVGAAEGPNYPAQVELQSRWIPYRERATAWAIAGAGESIGTFLALLVGPYLVHSFGWESVFIASGAIGLLWAASFAFLGARSPAAHRCVGGAERAHIEASRPPQPPRAATPWRRIATNVPFLALIFTHCAFNWTGYASRAILRNSAQFSEGLSITSTGTSSPLGSTSSSSRPTMSNTTSSACSRCCRTS